MKTQKSTAARSRSTQSKPAINDQILETLETFESPPMLPDPSIGDGGGVWQNDATTQVEGVGDAGIDRKLSPRKNQKHYLETSKVSKLLVSFSGGETSAYMIEYIKQNLSYDQVEYVFTNTGLEHEKTLEFVQKVAKYHKIKVHWIESVVYPGRKGCGFKIVDFETAARNGEPFEESIKKYGIPNASFPHCTRDLKVEPMRRFVKGCLGWTDHETAIGIRADEWDRASAQAEKYRLIYPLIDTVTKQMVNQYWDKMPFRLEIPGYVGNCTGCWKKTDRKLAQIAIEEPQAFDFFREMEAKYENFVPPSQAKGRTTPIRFYRQNRTVDEVTTPRSNHQPLFDERQKGLESLPLMDLLNSCSDSCEVY
jgi:3'-phosphoadenosine 5'-phosphosulfate sulfotransferase (PAPS reductase)/FAD synthetase